MAAKIKEQINIDQLVKDKILRQASVESFELTAFKDFDLFSPEQMQNERTLNYVRNNPLDLGDLGFKNLAMQRLIRAEKQQAKERSQTRKLPEGYLRLPPEQQRRSMIYMKQLELGKSKKVLSHSMVQKLKENKFYAQLERSFKQLAD